MRVSPHKSTAEQDVMRHRLDSIAGTTYLGVSQRASIPYLCTLLCEFENQFAQRAPPLEESIGRTHLAAPFFMRHVSPTDPYKAVGQDELGSEDYAHCIIPIFGMYEDSGNKRNIAALLRDCDNNPSSPGTLVLLCLTPQEPLVCRTYRFTCQATNQPQARKEDVSLLQKGMDTLLAHQHQYKGFDAELIPLQQ